MISIQLQRGGIVFGVQWDLYQGMLFALDLYAFPLWFSWTRGSIRSVG